MQKTQKSKIPIAKPIIGREEEKAVLEVLRSGMLAQGARVEEFENKFAKYIGTKYAIQSTSGTTALHLALLSLGIGKGDEVITTPFTFVATTNAILYTGAKPVFVDIDENTFNINPDLIEKKITKKTKAILVVHLYGLPADMIKIGKIARKYKIPIIEDAAQAHGAKINKRKVGSFGSLGCFSFYATKNMTTGEGGMVTTNSFLLAQKAKALRNHGMMQLNYKYDSLGYNYCPTNIAAAIGLCQLDKLDKLNSRRIKNAACFNKNLVAVKGIKTPVIPKGYTHVFHQYTLRVSNEYKMSRDSLIKYLANNGVSARIYYPIPLHKQKLYKDLGYRDSLPVAERASAEVISIPIHPSVAPKDIKRISKLI